MGREKRAPNRKTPKINVNSMPGGKKKRRPRKKGKIDGTSDIPKVEPDLDFLRSSSPPKYNKCGRRPDEERRGTRKQLEGA